ncbi:TPA: hypothetical protein DEP21_06540 [Patescibacteria group bacterium]|nr:hypothetical protein [Candidatus Gracilibacteria bacterium]
MKHKKFLSKNFYIILGSTLLIIGILASFMVWGSQNLPKIFEYVPSNLDQVMINWPAKNINAATTAVVEIPEAVKAQFQQIEVMIIGQKSDL